MSFQEPILEDPYPTAATRSVSPESLFVGSPHRRALISSVLAGFSDGQGVQLVGTAGLGKSRTLRELADSATAAGLKATSISATASMSSVPFGVFLRFVDTDRRLSPDLSLVGVAARLRSRIRKAGTGVLIIDDVHLLDPASAGLVYELATSGLTLGLAARTGERQQDAIARLVRDGVLRVWEVPPLDPAECSDLAAAILGGSVDSGLAHELYTRSGGNPLAIRCFVRAGLRAGVIESRNGVWLLQGRLPIAAELADVVDLGVVTEDLRVRDLAEQVAIAGDLPVRSIARLHGHDVLDLAEEAGVLALDPVGDRIRLAHPMFESVLLGRLAANRRRRHLESLIDTFDPAVGEVDRVRLARWRLELGRTVAIDELLALAELTLAGDPLLSEFFLRSAIAPGGGARPRLRLAEVLAHQHRSAEAMELLGSIDRSELDSAQALAVELTRAFLLAMPGQRPEEAIAFLDGLIERHGHLPMIDAMRSTALYRAGRHREALRLAESICVDPASPVAAAAHSGLTALSLHDYAADGPAFSRTLARVRPLVDQAVDFLPEGPETLRLIEALQPVMSFDDHRRSAALATEGYRRMLVSGEDGVRTQYGVILARSLVLSGEAAQSVRLLHEAETVRGMWSTSVHPWIRSALVVAHVAAGDQTGAEEAFARLSADRRAGVFVVDHLLAEAAIFSGRGDLDRAAAVAERAVRSAPAGQNAMIAGAAYDGARYGSRDAATVFLEVARRHPGESRDAEREHARAIVAADPRLMERAAAALRAAGLSWYALEAFATAADLYRSAGDGPSSARVLQHFWQLADDYPSIASPVVHARALPALTPRELKVLRLAAAGSSDRGIADLLEISIRTVQTHLVHVYSKLGVHGRTGLRETRGAIKEKTT
jgi:DNA-binding CsgD family transcriptional regulator